MSSVWQNLLSLLIIHTVLLTQEVSSESPFPLPRTSIYGPGLQIDESELL